MSALGQKQTFGSVRLMSAVPPKTDIGTQSRDVRFVPKADKVHRSILRGYSITSSLRFKTSLIRGAHRHGQMSASEGLCILSP